jgi:hypothetical protein
MVAARYFNFSDFGNVVPQVKIFLITYVIVSQLENSTATVCLQSKLIIGTSNK